MEFLKSLRFASSLGRKKSGSNKYTYTGSSKTEEIDIQLFKYKKEEYNEIKSIIPNNIA